MRAGYFTLTGSLGKGEGEFSGDVVDSLEELLVAASNEAGVEVPELTVYKADGFNVSSFYTPFGSEIKVSEEVLESFSLESLEPLIYHEVHHLKEDSKTLFLLSIVSRFTLFGEGFISAYIDLPSREFRADWYAAEHTSTERMIEALKRFHREGEGRHRGVNCYP